MKKLALIAATLICFAGCARNDTEGDYGATETTTTDTTATGAAGTSETGADNQMMTDTNRIMMERDVTAPVEPTPPPPVPDPNAQAVQPEPELEQPPLEPPPQPVQPQQPIDQ